MASTPFQISALFLAVTGSILLLVATVSNSWKSSISAESIITSSWIYEGLWMNCAATAMGSLQCKKFYSFLSLDTMSVILEIAGFLCCVSGWVMVGAILSNSYWKVSSIHGSVITTSTLYENLWHSCAEDSTGVSNCREFDTLLALPAYIQACRALMVTSLVLGLLGTLLTVFGLKCTQLGTADNNTKTMIATIGGMVFILSGLSSMVALSWYASQITAQFFDSLYGGTKYELGHALYIGWAGSLLSVIGGILLTCSCKGSKREKHRNYDYDSATTQKASEPFIYNKALETVTSVKDYV